MEPKKVTVGKLRTALDIATRYEKTPSPFGWACLRAVEKITKTIKPQTDEVQDLQRELAMRYKDGDKKGCYIPTDAGGLQQTPESIKKIDALILKQNEEEVDYEPYYAKNFDEIKHDLRLINAINGILIEEIDIEAYVSKNTVSVN